MPPVPVPVLVLVLVGSGVVTVSPQAANAANRITDIVIVLIFIARSVATILLVAPAAIQNARGPSDQGRANTYQTIWSVKDSQNADQIAPAAIQNPFQKSPCRGSNGISSGI